jgi:5-methylcytosine-specific restriction protein A
MPYQPLKPCRTPGCPALVSSRDAYCREHSFRNRKVSDPIYDSAKHLHWRGMVLRRHPICCTCGDRPASHADHIIPLTHGGGWSLDNGQGLCPSCHNKKTANERIL